jgi:RHH-type rel operon transcriptional repressor/antitoxin RelB
MALSVRMNPLLEKQIEMAAKRQGITKSQFVINAVERALGRKNPYELMLKLIAEEEATFGKRDDRPVEPDYDSVKSKAAMVAKLKAKHGVGRSG